ncbi:hypothetical protein WJX81_002045 [Elliptochloris bilobata]|uniref:NmrA-like domain-containing protein n=1 Tax=Elliptochloris bilobata TaxID=381761 RepID=A0AAW1QX90_9CHLO
MARPVIVVLGATGSQGGGVVAALLKQDKFSVRAVTRSAAKAKDLAEKGVEVIEADMNDKASLVKAFESAEGAFIVTDFWGGAGLNAETEIQQGKNAVDAAKEAKVGHVVLSALEDPRKLVPKGALPELSNEPGHLVSHFETKAEVEAYLEDSGVPFTALHTSIFYDNFIKFFQYQRNDTDGSRMWCDNLGTAPLAAHAASDIGGTAAVVFADPTKYAGKVVPVVAEEYLSWPQAAEILTEVTGFPVKYVQVSDEEMAKFPFPGAEDLMAMFRYYRMQPFYNNLRNPKYAIFHGPSFRDWATENRDELIAAIK